MIRQTLIKVDTKQELFLAYLTSINWTLPEQLTESELEVLSYLVYYNNIYAEEIKSDTIRYDLLFSSNIKKRIREEFGVDSQKFETYLNKLRKKGVIKDNKLSKSVVITMEDKLEVRFNFEIKEKVKIQEVILEEPIPEIKETIVPKTIMPSMPVTNSFSDNENEEDFI